MQLNSRHEIPCFIDPTMAFEYITSDLRNAFSVEPEVNESKCKIKVRISKDLESEDKNCQEKRVALVKIKGFTVP
jgi:hypothetical protein